MALPPEVAGDIGDLVAELQALGAVVESARYDARFFGNFVVSLRSPRGCFQVTRDRSQYIVQGPPRAELEPVGLWRAFDQKDAFSAALLAWMRNG